MEAACHFPGSWQTSNALALQAMTSNGFTLADEPRIAEQPDEHGRALQAGSNMGDNTRPLGPFEDHRPHQERRIRRNFPWADEFNLKPRRFLG
jgi:hypothetical protein